jgi:parallel beta-helix repeat protein
MVISGKKFTSGNSGIAIKLTNCENVTIEYNEFDLNSGIIGVQLQDSKNITIRYNKFKNFRSGVYAINTKGGVNVHCNEFKDIAGEKPRGQVVQFNKGSGAGNRVNYNTLDHTFGAGYPEDLVNMYGSSGTDADPIQIIGNKFRGGGPSSSGGGIMVGDNGGGNIRVEDNILLDPGQYGIGSPAGKNIKIKNNKVYARQQSFTNVGIYVGLKSEIDAGFACEGPSIEVSGNQVNWTSKSGGQNDFWFYSGCPGVVKTNNTPKANLGDFTLPTTLSLDPQRCPDTRPGQGTSSSAISSSILVSSSSVHIPLSSSGPRAEPLVKIRLFDAENNQMFSEHSDLQSGDTLCVDQLGSGIFAIDAQVGGWIQAVDYDKVRFDWNGVNSYRVEGLAPFVLDGDDTFGDYYPSQVLAGINNLSAHLIDLNGTSLWSKNIGFHAESCEAPVQVTMPQIRGAFSSSWELRMNTGSYLRKVFGSKVEIRALNGELVFQTQSEDPVVYTDQLSHGIYYLREF